MGHSEGSTFSSEADFEIVIIIFKASKLSLSLFLTLSPSKLKEMKVCLCSIPCYITSMHQASSLSVKLPFSFLIQRRQSACDEMARTFSPHHIPPAHLSRSLSLLKRLLHLQFDFVYTSLSLHFTVFLSLSLPLSTSYKVHLSLHYMVSVVL